MFLDFKISYLYFLIYKLFKGRPCNSSQHQKLSIHLHKRLKLYMFRKAVFLVFITLLPFTGKCQVDTVKVDTTKVGTTKVDSISTKLLGTSVPEYEKYHWDTVPKLHKLSPEESKMGMVVIKDKRIIEYSYDSMGNAVMYITRHKIIRVNSEKAVEENNTVYIPMGNGVSVISIKARAITKDGKVTYLNQKNIKDVANYDNLGAYKIFAIDGVEQGGEVEYLYTIEEPFRLYGTEYIRVNALHKDVEVDLYSPGNLVFETKSYNGFPPMKLDTNVKGKRLICVQAHNIKGYAPEDFSAGDGALMRMEYKFTYNTNNDIPGKKLYTYADFCQRLFAVLDKESTHKEKKITHKEKETALRFVDTMNLGQLNEEQKIRKIESRIKNSISLNENDAGDSTLPEIFKDRTTNEIGLFKLYHFVFNAASINHQIVLTTDRTVKPFDPSFQSWTYLQKYLFYFPATGKFIAPTEIFSRYGFPPPDWICQKGLFIRTDTVGNYVAAVGQVEDIGCNDYKKSMSCIYADVKFNLDMGNVALHYKETFTGYEAYDLQPLYPFLSDEQKKNFANTLFQQFFPDAKPANVKVSGYAENDLFRKPFVVKGDFSTNTVLEQAGNQYLFKIGLLIGPQSELYRDTVRHTPIDNDHNKGYYRQITFTIPDGYKIANLDAVNMDVSDGNKGDTTMEFHSFYRKTGNKVTVMIDENYRQLRYPISMYEKFRKVINASADFNKVVLFLEKK